MGVGRACQPPTCSTEASLSPAAGQAWTCTCGFVLGRHGQAGQGVLDEALAGLSCPGSLPGQLGSGRGHRQGTPGTALGRGSTSVQWDMPVCSCGVSLGHPVAAAQSRAADSDNKGRSSSACPQRCHLSVTHLTKLIKGSGSLGPLSRGWCPRCPRLVVPCDSQASPAARHPGGWLCPRGTSHGLGTAGA